MKNPLIDRFASDNVKLILSQTDGNIISLDGYSSEQIWKTSIGNKNSSIIRLTRDKILAITLEVSSDSEKTLAIRNIESLSGVIKDIKEISNVSRQIGTSDAAAESLLYFGTGSEIIKVNLEDESQSRFSNDILNDFEISEVNENTISDSHESNFAFAKGSEIIFVKNSSGKDGRNIKTSSGEITALLFADGSLFWGDNSGKVFRENPFRKSFDRILRTGGRVSFLQNIDKNILITSNDNYIYLYSPENKKQIWKRRLSGRVTIKPKLQKNLIAVTTNAESDILFMNLENGKVFNRISLPKQTFIRDFQIAGTSLYVLTNLGLVKFSEECKG